ncbi:hypothetical protein PGT21_008861 [Puccinia graminis f. sp. tritici]|uniref:Uncharacterized protein n=1 Tax=Puccinia graminis f. sp. tritici TaxID=56615 RepID=A0A5B0NHQ6_PUCGR|nr:hypothetical protein PGTUg99_017737 [Puccinia graminis f. sp. tritici]KAA1112764.1 hypothetical protein PGT21_008861 [Puccinia graminis f. sp. tritici]
MRKHEMVEKMFDNYSNEDAAAYRAEAAAEADDPLPTTAQEDTYMKFRRNRLADKLWDQYKAYNQTRNRSS